MPAAPRPRGSKTGCITCRIRKVKCDERKPECQRCLSTGRKCDGYSTLPFSRDELHAASVTALVTDPAFRDISEKRHFQFFRQNTVVGTNCLIDSRFWDRIVLQASHNEPAIKHAVLALSSLHQSRASESDHQSVGTRSRVHADTQYQMALEKAQILLSSATANDLDRVLIACIVFSIYEAVRGFHVASQQHLNNGRRIIEQYAVQIQASRRSETAEILHLLTRLDVAFADQSPQIHTTLGVASSSNISSPWEFEDLREAQRSLFDVGRTVMLLQSHTYDAYMAGDEQAYTKYKTERRRCVPMVLAWKKHFDTLLEKSSTDLSNPTVSYMTMSYNIALIFAQTEDCASETQFDPFLPQFQAIASCGEAIVQRLQMHSPQQTSISYEPGYISCVFFTATRCRDPQTRRRAVSVLRAVPRQEGIWKSTSSAQIAEQLVEMEEAGLSDDGISSAAEVPEHKRVWQLDSNLGPDEASITAQFCGVSPGSSTFTVAGT